MVATFFDAGISIHAPLAGSDQGQGATVVDGHISIHAPLAGSDFAGAGQYPYLA